MATEQELTDIVKATAKKLRLLDKTEKLRTLDSLNVISFVAALEDATDREIAPTHVKKENFLTVESVASLLASCTPRP